jgi:hypothetical protein
MQVKTEKKKEPTTNENESVSELNEPFWAVVSFESVAAESLTYDEARAYVKKLEKQKVSGLSIVTNEVAERMKRGL